MTRQQAIKEYKTRAKLLIVYKRQNLTTNTTRAYKAQMLAQFFAIMARNLESMTSAEYRQQRFNWLQGKHTSANTTGNQQLSLF